MRRSPANPFASSWILTSIASAATGKDAKTGGGEEGLWASVGEDIDFEAVHVRHTHNNIVPKSSNIASYLKVHGV